MFCTSCGRPDPDQHETCRRRAPYEPPRFCPDCARRMVVQVLPTGWRARCSEHGTTSSR